MILKGNQRSGGQQLAAHLMNSFDNERVEVVEVRGAVARDLSGAFAEWAAMARGTQQCRKELYSLSLDPDPAQGRLTREQYIDLMDRTERSLKLVGQPRAVVFHEKRGDDGELREHCHVVWSRIDAEEMKAVQMSHHKLKLRAVAQEFCRDHGLELPEGMKPGKSKNSRRDRFNERAKREDLAERQQRERTGEDKAERMAKIAACWNETSNGPAFVQALEAKGYFLAAGDRRAYVVVDFYGEVHSLSRQLAGVAKSKQLGERLDGYPVEKLPSIDEAKDYAKSRREEYEKQRKPREPSELEKRTAALREQQQERRDKLDKERVDVFASQLSEREGLRAMQEAQNAGIVTARLQKQRKGILAFLARITGISMIIEKRQEKEDHLRAREQAQQTKTLQERHDRELFEIERRGRDLQHIEERENRSADFAAMREFFKELIANQRGRTIKPEFDRAAQGVTDRAATGDDKAPAKESAPARFNRAAKPASDLTEEFNREVENRRRREESERDLDTGRDRSRDPKDPNR